METNTNVKTSDNNCSSSLSALRDHLVTASPDIARQALDHLDLNDLFKCLQTSDTEQVATACEVLELCFSKLSIDFDAYKMIDNLSQSLQHQSSTVRIMAVNEIHRQVKSNNNLFPLPDHLNIAIMVTKSVCDQDLKIAVKAMEIISLKDWLQHPQIINEIKKVLDDNDTSNRCKCYEVILSIVKEHPNRLKDEEIQLLLDRLINELKTDDVLMQLNIMELLSNLAVITQGLDFLIENDVLKQLSDMVRGLEGNPMANIVIPGLMRFFGTIAHKYPTEIYRNYPVVVDAIFNAINENNPSTLPTALDTLGYVGATIEGKLALGSLGRIFIGSLSNIGNLIKNSSTELKVRALNCIEYLIGVKVDDDENDSQVDQRVVLMTREWFRELSEKPTSMELLFSLCKNPFPELRINALKVLAAVCQHNWGIELVKYTSGMVEFLLDRSVEHEKESKHIKHDVISVLSSSDIFDTNTLLMLKAYVKEGPFFVQGITEVAIEGDE